VSRVKIGRLVFTSFQDRCEPLLILTDSPVLLCSLTISPGQCHPEAIRCPRRRPLRGISKSTFFVSANFGSCVSTVLLGEAICRETPVFVMIMGGRNIGGAWSPCSSRGSQAVCVSLVTGHDSCAAGQRVLWRGRKQVTFPGWGAAHCGEHAFDEPLAYDTQVVGGSLL
jgi:hypothetical protein